MIGKRLTAVLLCVLLAVACFSCKRTDKQTDAQVWTAPATEKILRDTDYSARYDSGTLVIEAFRNEYESAQIIVTPESDCEYTVSVSELRSAAGDILPAEAFTVYHEKYILVETIKDFNAPTGTGYYPDALLPYETAVEFGENAVSAGRNQGIWVTAQIPKDQKAGVYTGAFTVTAGGKSYSVPAEVTVYDFVLPDETHSKSSFMIHADEITWGELDSTVEMYEKYYDFMLDYRISPQHLPGNDYYFNGYTQEKLDRFLQYAEKYTRDARCSHFNIPFDTMYLADKGITSVDFDLFERTLTAMAEYSVEHQINLFEKAGTYFIFFDEYSLNGTGEMATYNLNMATDLCENLAATMNDWLTCEDAAFQAQLADSLAGIKHIVTGSLTDELQVDKALVVPKVSVYNSADSRRIYADFDRKSYGDDGELWWYTCMEPHAPFPTYHTEDVLLSSRLLSWMAYSYNVVGNLYWNAALYARRDKQFDNKPLQDFYGTALRYPGANGDGYLLYPGRPYGIEGPVGSVRLHSIRDGNEDYEVMYALEQAYAARGVSEAYFETLLAALSRNLYSGTQVRIGDALTTDFAAARETLAQLIVAEQKTGLMVEYVNIGRGTASIVVSAPDGVAVFESGAVLQGVSEGGIVRYTIEKEFDLDKNFLTLTATKGSLSCDVQLFLGGKTSVRSAAEMADAFTFMAGGDATVETVDGKSTVKLTYSPSDYMAASFDAAGLNIDATYDTLTFDIYCYTDTLALQVFTKCERSSLTPLTTYTLQAGWNTITLAVTDINCAQFGKLDQMLFVVSDAAAGAAIALGDIVAEGL